MPESHLWGSGRSDMPRKTAKKKIPQTRSLFFLIVGIALLSLFIFFKINQSGSLSFNTVPRNSTHSANIQAIPETIEIAPLSLRLPVQPAVVEGTRWQINEKGASYLSSSARVGEKGNIVIYAHNKATSFGPLAQIKIGDPITLKTRSGKNYSYGVYKIFMVNPNQVEVLQSKGAEELTLYTCTGFADSKRLIVKAKPL